MLEGIFPASFRGVGMAWICYSRDVVGRSWWWFYDRFSSHIPLTSVFCWVCTEALDSSRPKQITDKYIKTFLE